jgi:alpha-L-rhamnosidase
MNCEQAIRGFVPKVIPGVRYCWPWEGDDVHASPFAWGDAATICPWELYKAYGKKEILEEQFESMKGWVDFVKNKGDDPEAWASGNQFGDWLGLDAEEGSYRGATDNRLLATAYLKLSTDLTVKAGKVLGKDVSEYEELSKRVSKAFNDNFVNEDGLLTCDTQTAYVVSLEFGLAPDKERYAKHLAEKIKANGNKIQTGFIGTAYIMDALTDNGYVDMAYTLLFQKEFPSWLYCVRKGATTVWEHWDGLKPDGSMWSSDMNSFNHYAYGAVASWLYGTVTGIKPDESKPGYENIKIKPQPDARLDYAYAELDTKYGTVKSGWKKTAKGYEISITVPNGATADVTVGDKTESVGAGEYVYNI